MVASRKAYLRSARALIQTNVRAARNVNGTVHMYADVMTDSMRSPIEETTAAVASRGLTLGTRSCASILVKEPTT
jgi:excinuclease UvrABC helicase subunit UvrB